MRQRNFFDIFFSLSLMCVFVLCSTLLLFFQIDQYQQQKTKNDEQASTRLIQSYLTMNFHQRKATQRFSILNIDGIQGLQIQDSLDSTSTFIYVYDGYLRELYQDEKAMVDVTMGDSIAPLEHMQIQQEGNLYTFSLLQGDKKDTLNLQTY